ncbi:ankyrin repeat domain-containing protein [Frateuria aurantia]
MTVCRRYLTALLVLLVLLAGPAAYLLSPTLRLALGHHGWQHEPAQQRVDAHRYDSEWFDAARAGRIDILEALLGAGYPANSQTHAGYTALILAAYDDQPAALDYLLAHGADPCIADHNGNTALMGALYKGELAIARRLLQTSCNIDQANHSGETALAFAALFGRLPIIPELVARGARLDHRDAQGRTALQTVQAQGEDASEHALRLAGATQ